MRSMVEGAAPSLVRAAAPSTALRRSPSPAMLAGEEPRPSVHCAQESAARSEIGCGAFSQRPTTSLSATVMLGSSKTQIEA